MNLGKVMAFLICAVGLWKAHFDEGILNNIEALLIMNMALMVGSTEKIIDAIKANPEKIVIDSIKLIKEEE